MTLLYALVVLFLLIWVRGCTTVASRSELDNPYAYDAAKLGLEEKTILACFNLHRGQWWNCYARGSWLLTAGHYGAALKDFNDAIDQRMRDSRDARTYGMHFLDYFPQRESGLAYCFLAERTTDPSKKKDLFGRAIARLETSLDQAPSSKAKFYLRRATEGFWRTTQEDTTPPLVWIANKEIDRWADVPTLYINGYAATLRIRASDTQSRVGEVWVGGETPERRLFVESAETDFNQPVVVAVDPSHSTKTVEVRAADLAGNESPPATVRLVVDTAPPTGTLRVRDDNAALLQTRVSVDLIAADDYGLRSVRVGDDPYDRRDCRGHRTWEGRFSVKPGDRSLAVEIVDQAGNVTAMSVALEIEPTAADIDRREPLFAFDASFRYGRNPWGLPWNAGRRVSDSTLTHLVQLPLSGIHRLPSPLGAASGYATTSREEGSPRLILLELDKPNTLVRTSSSRYLLRGQVQNARDLDRIIIKVDSEELAPGEVPGQGDPGQRKHTVFSAWVPLPDCNKPRSIVVEAQFVGRGSLRSEPNLCVERVPDLVWDSRSVYSIVLLPLEDDYCLGGNCSKADRADAWVLDAVQGYHELGAEDGHSHQRFDCQALSTWDAVQVMQRLETHYRSTGTGGWAMSRAREKGADRMIALGRIASDLAQAYQTDLAVYGLVTDEGERFDLKLGFTGAESKGRPLLPDKYIDIYGIDRKSEHYINGLISKLQTKIPRVRGQVESIMKPRTIVVNRGEKDSVFANMSFVLYDVSGSKTDPSSARMCEARATSVSERRLNAEVQANKWPAVLRRWRDVHVISK